MSQRTNTNIAFWDDKWEKNTLMWHKNDNHHILEKHFEKLTEGRSGLKFFFPLCGKAVDMIWVSNLGHQVIGIESSQIACEQFFTENNIKFTQQEVNGDLVLFTSDNQKIKIYNGDFFKLTKEFEGLFDCVWDRGSLVALPADVRIRYSEHILSLLSPNFRYLLDTFDYNPEDFPGPPHAVLLDEIQALYGSTCSIEKVDEDFYRPFCEAHKTNPPKAVNYLMKPI